MVAESIDSLERIKDTMLEYKEIGQFLYMDVGRWGGDKITRDAWTKRRNFGLVCGSGAILCDYKDPNTTGYLNCKNINSEVRKHPDIQKMIPLLKKLSERSDLGPVTVVNALVCTDGTAEAPSSDEILVFLGDIHAPIMNYCNRTYLQDKNPIDITWAWSRGRLDISDKTFMEIKEIENEVVNEVNEIINIRLRSEKETTKITAPPKDFSKNSFEFDQFMNRNINETIDWGNFAINRLKKLLISSQELKKSQLTTIWDDNTRITGNDAFYWFNLYHGDGKKKGGDIFQNAERDLFDFLTLLLDYQKNYTKQGSIPAKLIQLGDLFDFWLGLKRVFDIQPPGALSDSTAQSFLKFWTNETQFNTSVGRAINLLLNGTEELNPVFVYGNHDNYRGKHIWQGMQSPDHFESKGIWAEHGHQSDVFNQDSNAIIGWTAALFGFYHPESRNLEEILRKLESLIFRTPSRRDICISWAAKKCQSEKKRIYVMGHTHEPLLKKVPIIGESIISDIQQGMGCSSPVQF